MGFVEDDKIRQIAEAYSLDAVDFARENFKVTLDWSDGSVRDIESILDRFHKELPIAKPSEEQIGQFGKMFGSYVGEVFRRNHSAKWGMVTLGEEGFPGMQAERTGGEFWPWGNAPFGAFAASVACSLPKPERYCIGAMLKSPRGRSGRPRSTRRGRGSFPRRTPRCPSAG